MNLIKHPEFGEIRTVVKSKETWFVSNDVCEILGLQKKGSHNLGSLDDDEKSVAKLNTSGGPQDVIVVNESGLYALIIRSNKPAARKLRKWITSEVLPAIRCQGYYVHPEYVDAKARKRLHADMQHMLQRYLTTDDRAKVRRKFGMSEWALGSILDGRAGDNAVMQELQRRAMTNKEAEVNAYAPERMQKVIQKLKY